MKCPGCGETRGISQLYRCDHCGDVRCNASGGCHGTMGGPKAGYGGAGATCKACRKGKYRKIG
jgi:hypothetical protein